MVHLKKSGDPYLHPRWLTTYWWTVFNKGPYVKCIQKFFCENSLPIMDGMLFCPQMTPKFVPKWPNGVLQQLVFNYGAKFLYAHLDGHIMVRGCPSPYLVYATTHLSIICSYLVCWLGMMQGCVYYTDFTDGGFLLELWPFIMRIF